jgi:hypothetical protein
MKRSLEQLLQELIRREPVAALLAGRVGDLAGQRYEWKLTEELRLGTSSHQIVLPADGSLFLEIDGDGAIFEGTFTFDAEREVFLIIGMTARIEGRIGIPIPARGPAGRAAFASGANVILSNGFLHSREETLRAALESDLPEFIVPGQLADRRPRIAPTGEPSQYVHLGGSGSIALSGSLRWRKILVEMGTVSSDDLKVQSALLNAPAGAEISWRGSLEGTFDLIVFSAGEKRLEARLSKSRLSQRRNSFRAEAEIAMAGTEAIAEAVLEPMFGPAADLVRQLEKDLATASDPFAFFRNEVEERLDPLLEDARVIESLRRWLEKVRIDIDLRRRLRAVLADAVGIAAARTIDGIAESSAPAIEASRELLKEYRLAIRRIESQIREAARVEVGLALTRTSNARRKSTDVLVARFDSSRADLLASLLHGDWSSTLVLAGEDESVEIEGSLRREGSLSIVTDLELRFLRTRAGLGSKLSHSWSYEIGAFGDVTIATKGTLEVWSRSWRSLRTLRVLADSRVTGTIAGGIERERSRHSVEWAVEMQPTIFQLERWEHRLARAGMLVSGATIVDDLALVGEAHRQRPFGEILLTARFAADPEALVGFVRRSPEAVRGIFARILAEEYADSPPLLATDSSGLPIFGWPEVLALVRKGEIGPGSSPLLIRGRSGREATIRPGHAAVVAFASRLVLSFGELQGDLRSLARRGTGLEDPSQIATAISATEKRMLKRIRSIAAAAILRRDDLGFAVFRTLHQLWTAEEGGKVVVVALRRTDKRRFVYESGA